MKTVAVFGTEQCAGCKVVGNVLAANGIAYDKKDMKDSSVLEEAMQLGIRGIPVTALYVDGVVKETVVGSTPEAINRILEIAA